MLGRTAEWVDGLVVEDKGGGQGWRGRKGVGPCTGQWAEPAPGLKLTQAMTLILQKLAGLRSWVP